MSELLKINDDLWVVWNHVCDAPENWGPRAEIWEYLSKQDGHHVCSKCGHDSLSDRFDRAETNGTSAMWYEGPPKGFVFEQKGWLPWERMEAFFDAYDPDKDDVTVEGEPFDLSLLDPFEEDDPQ